MVAGCLGFFAMFLVWFSFSVHFPISVIVADLCYDIEVVSLLSWCLLFFLLTPSSFFVFLKYSINQRLIDRVNMNGTYGALDDIAHCTDFNNTLESIIYTKSLENQTLIAINQTTNATEKSDLEGQLQVNLLL